MDKRKVYTQINQQWQQDDEQWFKEIEQWRLQARQWTACLFLLEKNIPEQAEALEQHKQTVEHHYSNLMRLRCGLDENCIETCPDHLDEAALAVLYKEYGTLHRQAQTKHEALRADFEEKKKVLRELAQRLLDSLD